MEIEKSDPKFKPRFFPSKITEKSSPGCRFGSQNGPELTTEGSKNPKMLEKNTYLRPYEAHIQASSALRTVDSDELSKFPPVHTSPN